MYAALHGPPPLGWPGLIDWKIVLDRAFLLKADLQQIVDDIDEAWQESFSSQRRIISLHEDPDKLRHRPRQESYFWKAITNDIRLHGRGYVGTMDGVKRIAARSRPG